MTLNDAHLFRGNLFRAACVAGVVSLATFGSIASASAAISHFTPVAASPVTVGSEPSAIAFDPNPSPVSNHPSMFVANYADGTVTMIDATTRAVLNTVKLTPHDFGTKNTGPRSITVDVTDDLVYVGNYDDSSVSILNGKTGVEARPPVSVGTNTETSAIAWDSTLNIIYVANYASDAIIALSGLDGSFIRVVPVDSGPLALAFDSKSQRLFVAANNVHKVDVIESGGTTSTALPALDLNDPRAIGIDSGKGLAYVANGNDATVTVFDPTSGEAVGPALVVGVEPEGVAVDEETHTAYVVNTASNTVSVIDETSPPAVSTSFAVGSLPSAVAVDSANHTVWVTNSEPGTVTVIQQSVSPTITSGPPSAATVGDLYSFTFTASGVSTSPMSFSLSGALPDGLTFANGVITGTPTESGDFTIALTASNGVDPDDTATYVLHVDAAAVVPPTNPPTTTPTTTPTTPGTHLPTVAG
ncbi:MAG: hypothetical protein JWQ64_1889 [Subtercola sp.]|nr:hypothetical protein [Subtercola sp.]